MKGMCSFFVPPFLVSRCMAVNDTIVEYQGSCNYISADNKSLPCQAWEYDRTDYESTIVTEASVIDVSSWGSSLYIPICLVTIDLVLIDSRLGFVQWNLVCDRRWMAAVSQSSYMLGALMASWLLGQLSDRLIDYIKCSLSSLLYNISMTMSLCCDFGHSNFTITLPKTPF